MLRKTILAAILIVSLFFSVEANPVLVSPDLEYSLWCAYSDMSTEFMNRIRDGKIDVLIINAAAIKTDNTIVYSFSKEQLEGFKTQVRTVNPDMKIYADIYSFKTYPDKTTTEARQKIISSVVSFVEYFGDSFDAIVDDTEWYTGTIVDHMRYFTECAKVIEGMGVPYYPWLHYNQLLLTTAKKCAVGLYGSHAYHESEWKTAFDKVQSTSHTKDGYMIWLIAEHYQDYPTIRQQLGYFNDRMLARGVEFYSRMESFGIWWYSSTTEDDWDAWISWVNGKIEPTPTPSPAGFQGIGDYRVQITSVIVIAVAMTVFVFVKMRNVGKKSSRRTRGGKQKSRKKKRKGSESKRVLNKKMNRKG